PAHRPLSNEVSEIEPEIQNALTRLINLPSEEDGVFAPRTVDLSAEALAAFEAFRTFLDQLKPDLDGREREWAAKGGTHALRLSGALAYLDWAMLGGPEPQSVGQQHVEAAVRLWREYFWPHSRAAVRQVGLTEKHANARRTLCWIRTNRKAEVSLQDIRQDALGRRLDAELTRSLLDGLVGAGWLKLVTKKTAGRAVHRCLEPVSKSFEENNEAGKLDKAEEIAGVVLPANEDPALPLNPGEEALDEPASHVAA